MADGVVKSFESTYRDDAGYDGKLGIIEQFSAATESNGATTLREADSFIEFEKFIAVRRNIPCQYRNLARNSSRLSSCSMDSRRFAASLRGESWRRATINSFFIECSQPISSVTVTL